MVTSMLYLWTIRLCLGFCSYERVDHDCPRSTYKKSSVLVSRVKMTCFVLYLWTYTKECVERDVPISIMKDTFPRPLRKGITQIIFFWSQGYEGHVCIVPMKNMLILYRKARVARKTFTKSSFCLVNFLSCIKSA